MNAWIFDIDGVLTDPQKKKVTVPENLEKIASFLKKGDSVAFLSGRALPWICERVLEPLTSFIENRALLDHVFVSGEFGYTSLVFNNGQEKISTHDNPILPSFEDQVKTLTQKYSESMFVDPDKKTMISIEILDGYDLSKYAQGQEKLLFELERLLQSVSLHNLEISHNIIAIDIKDKKADKYYSASEFLKWLQSNNMHPEKYVAVGDNTSDMEIAKELNKRGLQVEFVFVGKEKNSIGKKPFPVYISKVDFELGTLEYLSSHV